MPPKKEASGKKKKLKPETGEHAKTAGVASSKGTGTPKAARFPIVCIGASAGGLDAIYRFFENMPDHSGMAFVIVTHLDPSHESLMPSLIQHHTPMKVLAAEGGMKAQPDHVYVIPPNRELGIMNGSLQRVPAGPRCKA